ncbi:lysozyme inhibitor LprI family protein [Duganella qianjiadongensis]|uniref:DUF1311 domain-containing protein n=1 Tax=Duganella qianjiadongensis TaxID=2692176 RepID=A0ABW9VT04_9BURK|nr:lysozyme inhibitor LprI family protein [Duganella qianjiadongensis]MYM42201.1 DUF1311 domain-containing protein [Duganella qianjiadongensis]
MMKKIVFALLCVFFRSAVANCEAPKTQVEMTECARQDYAEQDRKLNIAYAEYRVRLRESQKKQLKDAQRAWIKFRDASCEFESSGVEGGSVYPMVRYLCLSEKTAIRLQEIKELSVCKEGNLSCPAY